MCLAQLLRWEPATCTFCGPQRNFKIAERSEISFNPDFWISEVFPRLKFRRLEKLFLFLVDWNWLYIVRIKWQNCQKRRSVISKFTYSHCKAWKLSRINWFYGEKYFLFSPILSPGCQFDFETGLNLLKTSFLSAFCNIHKHSSFLPIHSSLSSLSRKFSCLFFMESLALWTWMIKCKCVYC